MTSAKDMKVLVVDDYATMRRILKNLLNEAGIRNLQEADSGASAMAVLEQGNFDLVISDWNMEPMTGLDLLKACRSHPRLKTIKFIMVTAESKTENVIAAKQAGVDNYIIKPFNAATLKQKIEVAMGFAL